MKLEVQILEEYDKLIKDVPDNVTIQKIDKINPIKT
jgi:hypothetical protein